MATSHLVKALVAYDGTHYVGWERQKNGLGIQEVLEQAVFTITREHVTLEASGRTDAGVHAKGQVVSFSLSRSMHPYKLRAGLNGVLPSDVSVLDVTPAPEGFHARFSAKSKTYRYTIHNHPARDPHVRHSAYHFPMDLDLDSMRRAAALFVGTHDFRAFTRRADHKKSCVRRILSLVLLEEPPFLHLEVTGTGFLYNMVRILVGTLLEVGLHKREVNSVEDLLADGTREDAGATVPPQGLYLMSVQY